MKRILSLLLLFVSFHNAYTQTLDENFNGLIKGSIDLPVKIASQQNKTIIGGNISSVGNTIVDQLFRVNEDGTLDESFKLDFEITGRINDIILDDDNKIFIVGQQLSTYGNIIRLNENGSYDDSFQPTEQLRNIDAIKVRKQSDGKYVIACFGIYYNNENRTLLRLNLDGSADDGFLGKNINSSGINGYDMEIDAEDNIYISGTFTTYNDVPVKSLVKLNSDGQINEEFNIGQGPILRANSSSVNQIEVIADNSIIITGNFDTFNETPSNGIAKLFTNGTVDTSFEIATEISIEVDYSFNFVKATSSNKLLVGGYDFTNGNVFFKIFQINLDGSKDDSFLGITYRSTGDTPVTDILANGNVVTAGAITHDNNPEVFGASVADASGNLLNIMPTIADIGTVYAIINDLDGGLIIGGKFSLVNDAKVNNIVRLNSHGTIDQAFLETIGSGFNRVVSSLHLQEDGQILVGGGFSEFNNQTVPELIRVSNKGVIDDSFIADLNIRYRNNGVTIIREFNGGLLVAGQSLINYSGATNLYNLIKLNLDGSLDTSFEIDGLIEEVMKVKAITIQEDNKILVGGDKSHNGGFLLRINPNGSLDNSFTHTLDLSNRQITTMAISATNKIILGTDFSSSFPEDENKTIWSLNLDGSLNGADELQITSAGSVDKIIPLSGDTILIAGKFYSVNDIPRIGLALVDLRGNVLDYKLNISSSIADNRVYVSDVLTSDSATYLGGNFSTINASSSVSSLAKVFNCGPDSFQEVEACEAHQWDELTITESGTYEKLYTNVLGCDSVATIKLTISTLPEIQIDFSDKTIIHVPAENENTDAYKYQWFDCPTNEPISGATSNNFDTDIPGEYYLEIINGSCIAQSICLSNETVLSTKTAHKFKLFPNPFTNELIIELDQSFNKLSVEIINVTGAVALSQEANTNSAEIVLQLDKLESGLYTLLIKQENEIISSRKIVKR